MHDPGQSRLHGSNIDHRYAVCSAPPPMIPVNRSAAFHVPSARSATLLRISHAPQQTLTLGQLRPVQSTSGQFLAGTSTGKGIPSDSRLFYGVARQRLARTLSRLHTPPHEGISSSSMSGRGTCHDTGCFAELQGPLTRRPHFDKILIANRSVRLFFCRS